MANHRIWAPWRLQYIKSEKPDECIFCAKPAAGDDRASLIVHRAKRCFVMLNAFPYTNGHVMVAPFEHRADLQNIDETTAAEMIAVSQRSMRVLDEVYGPEGYNLGANLGSVAGAGVEDHVHLHVVPRWKGDTNFMPVLADTRVLPQRLADSWAAIHDGFAAMDPR